MKLNYGRPQIIRKFLKSNYEGPDVFVTLLKSIEVCRAQNSIVNVLKKIEDLLKYV